LAFYSLEDKQIYEMKQSLAVTKISKGREVGRISNAASPLIPRKMSLEIPDTHAALRLVTAEPEFFYASRRSTRAAFQAFFGSTSRATAGLYENISVQIHGANNPTMPMISTFQTMDSSPAVFFRYTVQSNDWKPGEYAFRGKWTGEEINSYIWDFRHRSFPAQKTHK